LSGLMAGASCDVDILYGNVIENDLLRFPPEKISKYQLYARNICHQAILAKRSLFSNIGQFNLAYKICGDPEWIIRAFKKGAKFKYINVTVAYYAGFGFSSNSEARRPYWEKMIKEHYSKNEIIAYWLVSILERTGKRIVKLDFSVPATIKRYFSMLFPVNRCR